VLRFVCAAHRRQVAALHAAGLAGRIRWGRPGLPVGHGMAVLGREG
jgi:hypothetical protein